MENLATVLRAALDGAAVLARLLEQPATSTLS
jgi:hypothetical protein